MPTRVVLWSELFWPNIGGAEIFAAGLMCALRERGFDFTVITSRDPDHLSECDAYRGIRVHRFPFREALAPQRLDEALRLRQTVGELVTSLAPELIVLNGVSPISFFCLDAVRRAGVPLLARLNRQSDLSDLGRYRDSLLAQVLAVSAWTVAVSQSLLEMARRLEPQIQPVSCLIRNGVAASDECPPPPPEAPLLLCLGRLVRDKGFDIAIDAFARIAETWPHARLRVVGEGPARADLERQAMQRGVAARVEFCGAVSPEHVQSAFSEAAVVLMPSRYEGLPSVALQAAAAGRVLVASRAGGLPETMRDGETGVLVDNDADAFSAAISDLLRDRRRADRMGVAAWEMARREFPAQPCFDAYAVLFEKLRARV